MKASLTDLIQKINEHGDNNVDMEQDTDVITIKVNDQQFFQTSGKDGYKNAQLFLYGMFGGIYSIRWDEF